MQAEQVFRLQFSDQENNTRLNHLFNSNQPIRHVLIDNFLQDEIAASIFSGFPKMDLMNTHYKGINEKKAEHSDFGKLHASFERLHNALCSPVFINWLTQVTGIGSLETINDRLGYGLHQGANKSFLDIHIDYNLHPIKKTYRKLNLIIFFNPSWQEDWGGQLELWDKDVKNCIQSIVPTFNRCVIFECSNISYHGYSQINVPEGTTRKSLYQYYFTPAPEDVSFHDTTFKPRPQEPLMKKMFTYSKDFAKNSVKKVLVRIGWKKFLE